MSFLEIGIIIILSYLAVYGIVNRICTCIEKCNMTTSYASTVVSQEKNEKEESNK